MRATGPPGGMSLLLLPELEDLARGGWRANRACGPRDKHTAVARGQNRHRPGPDLAQEDGGNWPRPQILD